MLNRKLRIPVKNFKKYFRRTLDNLDDLSFIHNSTVNHNSIAIMSEAPSSETSQICLSLMVVTKRT